MRYVTLWPCGRQPNFAALNRGCHLCSAGWPSRWALAHILVVIVITDEYDLGGTVALLLQDHLTMLIVSHVTTNQSMAVLLLPLCWLYSVMLCLTFTYWLVRWSTYCRSCGKALAFIILACCRCSRKPLRFYSVKVSSRYAIASFTGIPDPVYGEQCPFPFGLHTRSFNAFLPTQC